MYIIYRYYFLIRLASKERKRAEMIFFLECTQLKLLSAHTPSSRLTLNRNFDTAA